jgi:hypothetical protein
MINIHLDASEKLVEMTICDNGMGMSAETVQKIQNHVAFTANKENGHGLGLQQVWEAIEYNRGKMTIESTVGQGTCFCLTFPRALSAEWLAQEITLVPDTILLILEDETLLHRAWEIRLGSMLRQNRSLQVHYFDQGEALLTHIQALTDNERSRVLLLADYELAYQKQTGLEIIIASKITNAILVTAYSSSPEIRKAVLELGIALLPKQLMDTIPIRIEKDLKKVL